MNESLRESVQRRIMERHKLNELYDRRIRDDEIDKIANDKLLVSKVRYKLQDWDNGNVSIDPETNQVKITHNGPSDYEQWRRKIVDKKRLARIKQEEADLNSKFRSPVHTNADKDRDMMLDFQVDQFLADYIRRFGSLNQD